jgi:hypothetical protein
MALSSSRCFYSGFNIAALGTQSWTAAAQFGKVAGPRRESLSGAAQRGNSDFRYCASGPRYAAPGNINNNISVNSQEWGNVPSNLLAYNMATAMVLPIYFSNTNTGYATDRVPVFSGLPTSYYTNSVLPSDFGLFPHYANNTLAVQDKMIIAVGVNEWEILARANGANATGASSLAFAARIV